MGELKLMKGNEALAEAAIRYGADAYFGYPITPQSEVIEYLSEQNPYERTGMVVLQAESELAAINMVYGAGASGKRVMTSSSSPGVCLKQEGLAYIAGAEIPCVFADVVRGGPGLGTIQPSQADYFQNTKGGGNGDYRNIVLAPASVQEMCDFVALGFELAFKYRMATCILSDGAIGQMMEKVVLPEQKPRMSDEEIKAKYPWAINGRKNGTQHRVITSLDLDSAKMEEHNMHLQKKYKEVEANEVRYEMINCEDAEYVFVAYGSSARIAQKSVQLGREAGLKVGLLRPITLWPYPTKAIDDLIKKGVKGFLSVELSCGQMIEDVRLACNGRVKAEHFGRVGGISHTPEEVLEAMMKQIIGE